eukprot:CAMPEP_0181215202 /NCGR_PEP_ID=MMETSP1096-20121128/25884_1 /TAXON_ID=156174 ORGANISM="Chrysochromulina ericina, Strain CCMP281" /NCGR_SAMPLE_ID=MMETSP1096 /ASSEMBLY_ACC=CAM_ASM_000453 /LENGTH=32 /DNA_ID= /DNA_START= /DNA_END= /DNA_ORIENTATION=
MPQIAWAQRVGRDAQGRVLRRPIGMAQAPAAV